MKSPLAERLWTIHHLGLFPVLRNRAPVRSEAQLSISEGASGVRGRRCELLVRYSGRAGSGRAGRRGRGGCGEGGDARRRHLRQRGQSEEKRGDARHGLKGADLDARRVWVPAAGIRGRQVRAARGGGTRFAGYMLALGRKLSASSVRASRVD